MAASAIEVDEELLAELAAAEDERARMAYALLLDAESALAEERHELALDLFLAVNEAHPHPGLYALIGACQHALAQYEEAVQSFEIFLEKVPRHSSRRRVEALLAESRAALEESLVPLISLVPPEEDDDVGVEEGADAVAPHAATPGWMPTHPEEEGTRRAAGPGAIYERWWFWAAACAAAAAAGGAVYAGTRREPIVVLPSGSLGSVDWR